MSEPTLSVPADPVDPRRQACVLYWQGWRIARIAEHVGLKASTLHSWKRRDKWDETQPVDRVEAVLEARLMQLIAKDPKEPRDYKELDLLGRQMERTARVKKYLAGGNETDLNPKVANRNAGPRKAPAKNEISAEAADKLREAFLDRMFGYQKHWYRAGVVERIRNLLKSRQIGATYYFAHEALIDAIETGRNQIFLSASKKQAHQFKTYIQDFARESADVELKGENLKLTLADGRSPELIFLGTNSRTAQSYHGNLYLDEYFWIPRFQELRKVAAGMASQKQYRQTYFSTPSSLAHEAVPFWDGRLFNKGRPKAEQIKLDVSHEALAAGRRCEDGQWRQIVTILDALAGGCDLFDVEQLRRENSPEEFLQLFMCQFIDDGESIFPLAVLQKCMVDQWEDWGDFKPFAQRPFGHREVWIGYDPARSGDSAGLIVLAPPDRPGGAFRVLDKIQFAGLNFEEQAERIRLLTQTYNVGHIGIDTTGLGQAVFELVQKFYPGVMPILYSVDMKVRLVMKAMSVIHGGRLQFDASATDLAAALMSIKKTMTASGRQMTFDAGRSEETSHADLAWALMHALIREPLEGATTTNSSVMEIF